MQALRADNRSAAIEFFQRAVDVTPLMAHKCIKVYFIFMFSFIRRDAAHGAQVHQGVFLFYFPLFFRRDVAHMAHKGVGV